MAKIKQQQLLRAVYNEVYGSAFDPSDIDQRVMLQKAVFMLHECGVMCGDYRFVWDQYGPFSAPLSDDMKKELPLEEVTINFSRRAKEKISIIRAAFSQNGEYSVRDWSETIASLLYIKEHMNPLYNDEQVIEKLEHEKAWLNNHAENVRAMNILREEFTI